MHRIPGHEGSCKCYHGHRYVAEIQVNSEELDELGRVVDFSVIKTAVGSWIERNFDHTGILYAGDPDPSIPTIIDANERLGKPIYLLNNIPTVENIAAELGRVASELLQPYNIYVASIRVWETPNCSAVWLRQK